MPIVSGSAECLHHLFAEKAAIHPDSTAIICGFRSLTYREVDEQSNQLARYLRAKGAGPGKLIGLLLERSTDICVALLAVLKSGAAYVPLDRDYPDNRIQFILQDCQVHLLLTHSRIARQRPSFSCPVLLIDTNQGTWDSESTAPLAGDEVGVSETDLCYIIYTSGTTGNPKGVEIEHRSVVNYLRGALDIYGITHADRVYQGFSIAFDASVEEIWLAFASGATMVAGTSDKVRSGAAVAELLLEQKVTVFSCVPTFLSLIDRDLPTVRLLILGGEPCSPELVARWSSPRRRILNTYGPTETTVVATCAECFANRPITIGKPLPNYSVLVLDEKFAPVPLNHIGELFIGGKCLARGYVNQPALTRERFIDGASLTGGRTPVADRYYRTGDLVRVLDSGELEFVGRADSQVKIRGFRVELSEVESHLLRNNAVQGAAATIHMIDGIQNLVAYVIPRSSQTFDAEALISELRATLPMYMMPTYFELVADLPMLPSGKIDRKLLPLPRSGRLRGKRKVAEPRTEMERRLSDTWRATLGITQISTEDDFFLDLGGHSLLAARLISRLRSDPDCARLSVVHLYENSTIRRLAKKLEYEMARSRSSSEPIEREPLPIPLPSVSSRHLVCGTFQMIALLVLYATASFVFSGLISIVRAAYQAGELWKIHLYFWGSFISMLPTVLVYNWLLKRLLIGRYQAGRYPIWGAYYFRFWLLSHLSMPVGFLAGTPLMPLYWRLMGARIGRRCFIDTTHVRAYDVLSIDDDTSINADAHLQGYTLEHGWLVIGSVQVGRRCFIGSSAVLAVDSKMEDDARLDDLSMLAPRQIVPSGEAWRGSPAIAATPVARVRTELNKRGVGLAAAQVLAMLGMEGMTLAAMLPCLLLVVPLIRGQVGQALALLPLAAAAYVVLVCGAIVVVKRVFVGRTQASSYSIFSGAYFRHWLLERLMLLSRSLVHTLYATLYLPWWLRALGAKIGHRTEISTVSRVDPDLLIVGNESFIADSAIVGGKRVDAQEMRIFETRIGARTFTGNSALVPGGAKVGDSCLIGCLSIPPQNQVPDGTSWLGSPSFLLPRRQQDHSFPEARLYAPPRRVYLARLAVDLCRVLLPPAYYLLSFAATVAVLWRNPIVRAVWMGPLLTCGVAVLGGLLVAALKWTLIGKFKPGAYPLWSPFVWLNELVTGTYEAIAVPMVLGPLLGTPILGFYMKLLGTKFGKAVCCETPFFTEFDLVSVGDRSCLNANSTIQTHLFEDRVLKMSNLVIGANCVIGNLSVILYDTKMGEGSKLGALSLLMKGETLPPGSEWSGVPSRATERSGAEPLTKPHALAS